MPVTTTQRNGWLRIRRSPAHCRAPAQVWNGTVVVPQETSLSSSDRIGQHTRRLTPAKGPSSGSQPGDHTPISCVMQHLDLTGEEAAALIKELADITGNDRHPFSPRIQTLRGILAKPTGTDPRASPAAEGLCPAESHRQKATPRVKSEPGPPMTPERK
jgi:hypothetical protein